MMLWRMERLILLGMTVLGGLAGTVCAANPTERRWNVAEGFVDAAASWQNGTRPAQGTPDAAGEMAYFTGAGDKTVRFPAGGWTDRGVFYFAKDLADGTTLTFDATGTSWTFAPGTYFSNWQILTLCGDNHSGISYPHILQVTANANGKVAEPIFTLTDGVVRFFKHTAQGNVLALERGTWDFTRTGASGTDDLLFFNAEQGGTDEVVLRAGTSLKTPGMRLNPNAGLAGARFRVEGGAHALGEVVVGGAKEASTTPVLFEMAAGTVAAGAVNVGNRTTTSDNRLALRGTAALTTEALTLSESGAGATVDLADRATLAVTKDLLFRPAVEGTVATLVATDDAVVTVAGFVRPNDRAASAARSELVLGGRARLRTTASHDGAGGGGLAFGTLPGEHRDAVARLVVADDAVVETAARTTVGQVSAASNVIEVCGNGTFINTSSNGGLILGRGRGGRGYLVVRDNGTVRLAGPLDLSGNLKFGDNLGGAARMDILGGTVSASSLSLDGTNAWANLAGGTTTFGTWRVGGEPPYNVPSEGWTLPTNTLRVTGGTHAVSGYDASSTSIEIGATNGNAQVVLEGGEVRASALLAVGIPDMVGNPALLTVTGGRLALAQKGDHATGDAKVMVGQRAGAKGRFVFTGGEVVANSIRGGSGASEFIADGGTFTVQNAVEGDWALSRLDAARLGAKGLTVNVPQGVRAISQQAFTDLEGADGLLAKEGVGALVVSNASEHARTAVDAGALVLGRGVRQFGRRLSIAPDAFVLVDVPADVGDHDVFTLEAELKADELARIQPEAWAVGRGYAFSQRTEGGVTTVVCTVTEGGPAEMSVSETTTFAEAQTLATRLTVGQNVAATFQAPVTFVGAELVIDVAAGGVVTFEQPVASVCTAVRKTGAGRVVFRAANPAFRGTWRQAGGVFDVRHADFGAAAAGAVLAADTFAYTGEGPGTFAAKATVDGGSAQKRVVVDTACDLTFAGGFDSLGGGLVKTGAGALTLVEPAGTFALNTASVPAKDSALASVPADGAAPPDASNVENSSVAAAGLQILSGAVRVKGAGRDATTVKSEQSIFVGTPYAPAAEAGLEIADCTYVADGTARATVLATGTTSAGFAAPYLTLRAAAYVSHRLKLGAGTPTVDVYPTATMVDATVAFESGFDIGCASDKVHPRLLLDNTQVTQYRTGYAEGHRFYRDFAVTLTNGALLNATYTAGAGNSWHGLRFENGAWGTLRVTAGSKVQTSRIESLNTGATDEKHVEVVFDGGTLEMTDDASGAEAKTAFAAPEVQGFTATGAGMEVLLAEGVTHTFATPFRGDGAVTKTGAGTMALADVADGKPVFRGTGDVVLREGVLDLGGRAETGVSLVGAGGVVSNGTCAVKAAPGAANVLRAGAGTVIARVVVDAEADALAHGQKIPVAAIEPGAPGAAVAVAEGCPVQTANKDLRGEVAVDGEAVVVTLLTRRRFFLILR